MLAISFAICSPADAEIPLESTIIDHTRLLRRALYARTKQNIASSDEPESGLRRERGRDAGRDQRGGPGDGELAAGAKAVEEKEEGQAVKRDAQPVGRPGQQQGIQAID